MRRFNWRTRNGFESRLLVMMVLTLLIIGVMQYVLTTSETKQRLLDEATYRASADVVFVRQAFDSTNNADGRITAINTRLSAISQRDGIRFVGLVDRYGVIVAFKRPRFRRHLLKQLAIAQSR